MQVMNGIAFDESEKGQKFDGNFITVLNKDKDEFEYYVQRLLGVGIENEQEPKRGKVWVPYINDKREDWSFLCENNRIIAKEDEILWRLEQFLNKDNLILAKEIATVTPAALEELGGNSNGPSTVAANSRSGEPA